MKKGIIYSFFIRKEHEIIQIRGKTKVPVISKTFTLNQVQKAETSHRTNRHMIQNYYVNVIVIISFYSFMRLLLLVLHLKYRILKMDSELISFINN